ncbi:4-phosphoerythronate dehydrogenase [Porticoccus sp.]|uniref:4-phosphoerythronate dehydrogenase n=1 Tax=Porticoccus sp. TaxID=2024853 RepID=UPI000C435CF7|nr:4-phosphoerythronate dehydrogenase [Porticoccus sp.]MAZ69269.1 erythronate-4-phosphate dehydrogenase [Porticoccus sp.]|tara:strand:+ start:5601 stop:6698 length:1098 start_codon:yes stop_codon:yes gene_type:complete
MKIVADDNMPLVRELFSPYGEVVTCPGRELTAARLVDADVLLVRSVTPVNAALLEGSPIQFVGSATIGVDHVDMDYLTSRNIRFASAPGCNANAVVQYVLSALCRLRPGWLGETVGIVGCGNVGGRLYRTLRALGVDCRCYDPFLDNAAIGGLTTFERVLEADILCLHTPLTIGGPYPTHHMLNEAALMNFAPGGLLLNAGRGPVVDNATLLRLNRGEQWQVVLDVWESEPEISLPLLEQVTIGTPHIAGYSVDGKINGTRMVCEAFCQWLGQPSPEKPGRDEAVQWLRATSLAESVLAVYDIADDDRRMRQALLSARDPAAVGFGFDQLRKTYPARREFQHFGVRVDSDESLARQLAALGFIVV